MKRRLLIALITVLGVGMLLYPGMAQWKARVDTASMFADASAITMDEHSLVELSRADDWNRRLYEGFDTDDYDEVLNFGNGLMGRVQVTAIDVDLPMYHGTSEEVLRLGLGHSQGSSLPVGGASTHAVLSAHTGMASARMLSDLPKAKIGDEVVVTVAGQVLSYEVTQIRTVLPEEVEHLKIIPGQDLITLLTCTPLGVNSHRLLVTAQRVVPTPTSAYETASGLPVAGFPWQFVLLGVTIVGTSVWALWPRRARVVSEP